MICPDCRGTRATVLANVRHADGTISRNVIRDCTRCGITGVVPDVMAEWLARGKAMRERRLAANRSQREEAARRGMSVVELSRMEGGRVEPKEEELPS